MPQKARPALFVLFGAFPDAEYLSVSILVDTDGHKNADIFYFTGPCSL